MNTAGHYDVLWHQDSGYGVRSPLEGTVAAIVCKYCAFEVHPRQLHKPGDKSGAGRYCRARARMVKHLHAEHRARMTQSAEDRQ